MLRLPDIMLVSMLEIENINAGDVTVSFSVTSDNKKSAFTEVEVKKPLKPD